jgi:PP-loop superfamily ATP-utilizing enzyme
MTDDRLRRLRARLAAAGRVVVAFSGGAGVREALDAAVRGAGFRFCALDLAGFGSGRMNDLIPVGALLRRPG